MNYEDRKYCEYWLCFWTALDTKLTQPQFTEEKILKLIHYELDTRKRKPILHRLMGRYSKLVRLREWKKVEEYIDNANQGESDRRVLEKES